MIRVYVDMVADLFHPGHVEFLRKARSFGNTLVVGIHSDDAVELLQAASTHDYARAHGSGGRHVATSTRSSPMLPLWSTSRG